jgi:PEP-CTERM motif
MKHLLSTLSLALAVALPAQAGLVTFDPVDEQGLTLAPGDTIGAQAFVFTQVSGPLTTLFAGDTAGSYASNGSNTLYAANDARFGLSTQDGSLFALLGLELGGGNLGFLADPGAVEPWAVSVDLLGTFGDGSQQRLMLSVDPASPGLAFQAIGWTGLREVQFSALGDYSVDNLNLAVPEPGGLGLLALGLLGARWRRRRAWSPRG